MTTNDQLYQNTQYCIVQPKQMGRAWNYSLWLSWQNVWSKPYREHIYVSQHRILWFWVYYIYDQVF